MRNLHRHPNTFYLFPCRTEYFKNFLFSYVIKKWSKTDPNICSSSNYHISRNALLKFIKFVERKIFKVGLSPTFFPQPCSKKYHHLFVWCLKLKVHEFSNCKICFLKKQPDLKTNCTRL